MSLPVPELLRRLHVTEPRQVGGLQVFGLRSEPASPAHDYRTLDEALADQTLEVTEVTEGGSVPTLRLVNKADGRVFLMAGEQLIGAKQNRVLNTSLMVEAKAELPVPVSCVEQGRWAYRSRQFGSHGTSSHSKLRAKMTQHVSDSYASMGLAASRQGEVWDEVSGKLARMGSRSDSGALEQAYADHSRKLEEAFGALPAPEGCSGALFVLRGKVVGADLFDRPETLAKLWPKLLRSYGIDALEESPEARPPLTRDEAERWLHAAADAEPRSFPSPGLGEDVRLTGPDVVGAGLVVEAAPVHVQLFSESFTKA
jgi:hypothetical protein